MRYFLLLRCLLVVGLGLGLVPASAQPTGVAIGLRGSVDVYQYGRQDYDFWPRTSVGGVVHYFSPARLAVTSGLIASRKGARYSFFGSIGPPSSTNSINGYTVNEKVLCLDLPLLFGYRFRLDYTTWFTPMVGIMNTWMLASGRTIRARGGGTTTIPARATPYQYSYTLPVELHVGWRVHARWQLSLAPYFRYAYSSRSTPGYRFPHSYGLLGEVRYFLRAAE